MANIKSQKKRIITNEKARLRNRSCKAELKTAVRRVHEAAATGDKDAALAAAQKACRLMLELEKDAGLIERKRQGLGKPSLIYVKNFAVSS